MDVSIHVGALVTETEPLLKTILKNGQALTKRDIYAPGPGNYRRLMRESIQIFEKDGHVPAEGRDILLDAILADQVPQRLVLSLPQILGMENRFFEHGHFLGMAPQRLAMLMRIFAADDLHFHFTVRNLATFLPALVAVSRHSGLHGFAPDGFDPGQPHWSQLLAELVAITPDARWTVWADEDAPILWPALVRRMTGLTLDVPIKGRWDKLATLVTPPGREQLKELEKSGAPVSPEEEIDTALAVLEAHGREDGVTATIELDGWDQVYVDHLTDVYEEDLDLIERIHGVHLMRI